MKKFSIALAFLTGVILHAEEINLQGDFAHIQNNGVPQGWHVTRAKFYEPTPKFQILKEKDKNILHVSDITGQYGFGWQSAILFPVKAGDQVTISANCKGKGTGWFTIETSTKDGKWTGGFRKQRFQLKPEWNEAKVRLHMVDFKNKTTGQALLLFGADKGSELYISDLKVERIGK